MYTALTCPMCQGVLVEEDDGDASCPHCERPPTPEPPHFSWRMAWRIVLRFLFVRCPDCRTKLRTVSWPERRILIGGQYQTLDIKTGWCDKCKAFTAP